MVETIVSVMAKAPTLGHCKTRLAVHLGDPLAKRAAEVFLLDTWKQLCSVADVTPALSHVGHLDKFPAVFSTALSYQQTPGDLGHRIAATLRNGLKMGTASIALGSDIPGFPKQALIQASQVLAQSEKRAVLGPSDDGGFWLIGINQDCPELLANLPWSQANTFEKTSAHLQSLGFHLTVTNPYNDIDTIDDLRSFTPDETTPHTRSFLENEGCQFL